MNTTKVLIDYPSIDRAIELPKNKTKASFFTYEKRGGTEAACFRPLHKRAATRSTVLMDYPSLDRSIDRP
eukprot:CAMPEP_0201131206 /NCGR_PEP_ID=MMETSP0850-20130426/42144_1 /ASSEMBLY_ACC=CAM_ASM_000622 /TAXON_ID=183588 /ORGANISM="Pseudo-nitzschia fraudulenta, Strain WWA7" /LENGTH=69 /DNA_ID=CAMNT_0047401189 /DNA_START=229 /DNA_END=435 /DNA_ORIENTATION=+